MSEKIKKWNETLFYIFGVVNFFLFIGSIVLSFIIPKKYYEWVHTFFILYVSLYLIIQFNPFYNNSFSYIDKRITFSSGVLLLSSLMFQQTNTLTSYVPPYLSNSLFKS